MHARCGHIVIRGGVNLCQRTTTAAAITAGAGLHANSSCVTSTPYRQRKLTHGDLSVDPGQGRGAPTDKPGDQDSSATSESDADTAAVSEPRTRTAPAAGSPRRGLASESTDPRSDTDQRGAKPYGRHASGQTAAPSSSDSVGRHRSDSADSGTTKAPSSQGGGTSAGSEGSERSAA